jgi:hypothetical protein
MKFQQEDILAHDILAFPVTLWIILGEIEHAAFRPDIGAHHVNDARDERSTGAVHSQYDDLHGLLSTGGIPGQIRRWRCDRRAANLRELAVNPYHYKRRDRLKERKIGSKHQP